MDNRKAIRTLIIANAISHFAQGISMMAIPWYFVHHLGEKELYNLVFVIVTACTFFWSSYAGTIVDRYPRKNVLIGLMVVGACMLFSVALTGFQTNEVSTVALSLVFGFTILNYNLHFPALYAWTQEMTTSRDYGKVNSVLEIQGQATTMIAGGVGVFLLQGMTTENFQDWGINVVLPFEFEAWSIYEIFLMDGITYVIAISLILLIRYRKTDDLEVDREGLVERFKNGIRFLNNNKPIFKFGAFAYSVFVVLIVHAIFLLPVYVDEHLNAEAGAFALAEVFYTVGALSAGLWIRKIFKNVHAVNGVIMLMILCVIVLLTLTFTKSAVTLCLMSALFGLSNSGTRVLRITYLFENVPNNTIGRVASVFQSLNIGARLFLATMFTAPFFVEDVTNAYLVEAMFVGVCMIPLLINRKEIMEYSEY